MSTTSSSNTNNSNRDSVRVVIRLRGGVTKTQEVNRDNKLAQTISISPENPLVAISSGQKNGEENSCLFKEVVVDKKHMTTSSSSLSPKERFTFDTVFSPETSQETVYQTVAEPAVKSALEGYNCCIMAFGQTGSGKTYTLNFFDEENPSSIVPDSGITPRVLSNLFERLSSLPESEISWTMELSIFELYNENLYDLLYYPLVTSSSSDGTSSAMTETSQFQQQQPELRIREDRGGLSSTTGGGARGVYIEGMTKRHIESASQGLRCIQEASKRKHMAETLMNKNSSRSHTIVQLFITQTNHVQGGTKLSSQFFLVDLAGSERVSRSGAAGTVLKEAQSINLSLTLLGNVINKLTDGKSTHIPS